VARARLERKEKSENKKKEGRQKREGGAHTWAEAAQRAHGGTAARADHGSARPQPGQASPGARAPASPQRGTRPHRDAKIVDGGNRHGFPWPGSQAS
jgi:hypothetical protein